MGVQRTHYVVLGCLFDREAMEAHWPIDGDIRYPEEWEKFQDDQFQEQVSTEDNFAIIVDGMNGEYIVAGKILDKATEECGGGLEPQCYCYDSELRKMDIEEVEKWLAETIPGEHPPIGVVVLTHVS